MKRRPLKIGDIVQQGERVMKIKGASRSKSLGVVIKINDINFPTRMKGWEKFLGRAVDVLWGTGTLSENFAEYSLELVDDELSHEQLELVAGGMSAEAFDLWRSEVVNGRG